MEKEEGRGERRKEEAGGEGGKEVREGRTSSLLKEDATSNTKKLQLCLSQFQPLEDAKGLEEPSSLAA